MEWDGMGWGSYIRTNLSIVPRKMSVNIRTCKDIPLNLLLSIVLGPSFSSCYPSWDGPGQRNELEINSFVHRVELSLEIVCSKEPRLCYDYLLEKFRYLNSSRSCSLCDEMCGLFLKRYIVIVQLPYWRITFTHTHEPREAKIYRVWNQ